MDFPLYPQIKEEILKKIALLLIIPTTLMLFGCTTTGQSVSLIDNPEISDELPPELAIRILNGYAPWCRFDKDGAWASHWSRRYNYSELRVVHNDQTLGSAKGSVILSVTKGGPSLATSRCDLFRTWDMKILNKALTALHSLGISEVIII